MLLLTCKRVFKRKYRTNDTRGPFENFWIGVDRPFLKRGAQFFASRSDLRTENDGRVVV